MSKRQPMTTAQWLVQSKTVRSMSEARRLCFGGAVKQGGNVLAPNQCPSPPSEENPIQVGKHKVIEG